MIDTAIANTREHLLSLRNPQGHWEGELSSSALSTATAVVALTLVDAQGHESLIARGAQWLVTNQNSDGGWGDTIISKSNLSTTLLCWSALTLIATQRANLCPDEAANSSVSMPSFAATFARCEAWIRERVGSLEPDAICKAVIARYGKDKTFSVPIMMTCAIGGRLGAHDEAWRRVLALPFELAAFPRAWFGAIGLPVVSYALPALIAIGHARFHHAPPAWWNPLRWVRAALWSRISPMLKTLQPSTGGYLEATPLTSFVTMALACAGLKDHVCVPDAVRFLLDSQRGDGAWPIDTNLATWATTLAVKALYGSAEGAARAEAADAADRSVRAPIKAWLLAQQYKRIHPFTNAAPGGWAWTDLPGGVPDADDTSGALVALWHLCESDDERRELFPAVAAGIQWLLDLQNRDGGIPTFCRGWGTLPFDRSTPEITAHAIAAWLRWMPLWCEAGNASALRRGVILGLARAFSYLRKTSAVAAAFGNAGGGWIPLWFGNEHSPDEENEVLGSATVSNHLLAVIGPSVFEVRRMKADLSEEDRGFFPALEHQTFAVLRMLLECQNTDGGWGGGLNCPSSVEETALAVEAISRLILCAPWPQGVEPGLRSEAVSAVEHGVAWLVNATQNGTHFPAAPIGLYFAKLWYHEKVYPVVWTLSALKQARLALAKSTAESA